jgi:hypothetical protein
VIEWSRSETLALANHDCTHCHGSGLRLGRSKVCTPCNCVLRTIFRLCFARFLRCATQEKYLSRVSLEPHRGRQRSSTWGRKDEEYIADFCLVSRRTLDEQEHRLFRYHFVLGADWKLCTRKLRMDRGNFFHAVYRIEQKLGRAFREVEPYALFPLDEYYNGASRTTPALERKAFGPEMPRHLRFPKPPASLPGAVLPVGRTA